jgi:hypothetical protein
MAAALPISPISKVFSRRWGISEITEAGIAITSFRLCMLVFSPNRIR